MTTLTLTGAQIGEALQFVENGTNTSIEIGRVFFAATDTVTLTFAPSAFDAAGNFIGGNGAIVGLTVTTAAGQVTTFGTSPDGLDVDPDNGKNGADFFYISEAPLAGVGGAYHGLQLEKLVVIDQGGLMPGATVTLSSLGTWQPGVQGGTGGGGGGGGTGGLPGGGTPDNDVLTGTAGADLIDGGAGNDTIRSLAGADTVRGGDGNDRIDGGAGNDRIEGGAGNDRLLGGAGKDRLSGGAGNDVIDGGAGADVLTGGLGGDTFVFGAGDRVTDFSAAQGDRIAFDASLGLSFADLAITQTAAGTTVTWAGGSMTLDGVTAPLTASAFDFGYVPSFDFV